MFQLYGDEFCFVLDVIFVMVVCDFENKGLVFVNLFIFESLEEEEFFR